MIWYNHDPPIELFPFTSRHVTSRPSYWCPKAMTGGHIGAQTSPVWRWTLFLCKKTFFCPNKFAYLLATWVKRLYISFLFKTVLAQPYGKNEFIVYAQHSRPQLSYEKICSTNLQTKRFIYVVLFLRSKKMSVSSSVISRVIGRGGCNINAIRETTGAHIDIDTNRQKTTGSCIITIK